MDNKERQTRGVEGDRGQVRKERDRMSEK